MIGEKGLARTIIITHGKKSVMHCYMQTNRITACLLVISVQAVNQYRKDPRLNQVIYGRVTVTGQQLPTKTKGQRPLLIHSAHIALLTHTKKTNQ